MHYPNLAALIGDRRRSLAAGPVALTLIEDTIALPATLQHQEKLGFGTLVAFCAPDVALPQSDVALHRVDCDVTAPGALPQIVNAVIAAAPGQWLCYGYNAEFLYFPFSETRNMPELLQFLTEERRASLMTHVIDLYPRDLVQSPGGVDLDDAWFDGAGYYATPRQDAAGAVLDRQVDVFGGLRRRFGDHVPVPGRRLNRAAVFRAARGLRIDDQGRFSDPEYNTYACPWHDSPTAAICSFRAAKALRRNPASRSAITTFHWPQSVRFDWTAQQLLDRGMITPGQWF